MERTRAQLANEEALRQLRERWVQPLMPANPEPRDIQDLVRILDEMGRGER